MEINHSNESARKPRIIFMGSPQFAVASLSALIEADYQVIAAITSTDKLGGRGKKKLLQSAVKKFCLKHRIPVLQPKSLKRKIFIHKLKSLQADLQIVVAFRMLPQIVWDMPSMGTINLHASLLPKYRGAAPINWAIINGEEETGLTTFLLRHEIDTGSILYQERIAIRPDDTAGSLHDRMMQLGAGLVVKTVTALHNGAVVPKPQDEKGITKAPKIYHDDCMIRFDTDVSVVDYFIRGLSPYPAAWTIIDGQQVKILAEKAIMQENSAHPPGMIETDGKTYLKIAAKNGWINVQQLQMQGKRKMDIKSFLNGYRIQTLFVSEGSS